MKQLEISSEEYRDLPELANSDLKLISNSPSDFIWSKDAPVDSTKSAALDFGECFHTAILEPEKFEGSFVIYNKTIGRDTNKFREFQKEQPESAIILLESEYEKIRLTVDSCKAHPTFNKYLNLCGEREKSIVGNFRGVPVKIRPDLKSDEQGLLCELKSSADLQAWRESATWKNPLFAFDYGHSAAMYMDVYQEYLRCPVDEYRFLVAQKSINCGRYPVAVIKITREELSQYGFFDSLYSNLDVYAECVESGEWGYDERFPEFRLPNSEKVEISFED